MLGLVGGVGRCEKESSLGFSKVQVEVGAVDEELLEMGSTATLLVLRRRC